MRRDQLTRYAHAMFLLVIYFFIGFRIERHETAWLMTAYFLLFASYLYILRKKENVAFWIGAAIFFRFLLTFSVPALSDDFYRFIWDGRLLEAGLHPFAQIPSRYMSAGGFTGLEVELYSKLNSKEYFTIYPPVSQFIFWFSVKFGDNSVYASLVILKVIMLGCEIGSLWLIVKLLEKFNLPLKNVLIYALNPLVIIELTGNTHFEAMMIFFVLLSVWLITAQRFAGSAISMAIAVCVKLLPLIFLPLLIRSLGLKRAMIFYLITGVSILVLFIPLFDINIVTGLQNSLGYYFQKFEFNASIYYLVREAGFIFFGYNIIQTVGWKLGLLAGVIMLVIAFANDKTRDNPWPLFIEKSMWCLLVFFLFTTTLHPWYITTLIGLSLFTSFRYPVLWSGLIFLTYCGYSASGYNENMFVILTEYVFVLGYFAYELWTKRKTSF